MKNNKQQIQENEYLIPYHYIPQYKNSFTQTLNWTWGINYISTIEFIIDKLKEINFKKLADIGCGDGRLVKELSETFNDKKIIGIDYSKKAIKIAKAFNPTLLFNCINIMDKKVNIKFDILTLIEVLEHIPLNKCSSFIKALNNLLNKNGLLLITVPHINKKKILKHFQHFSLKIIEKYFIKNFIIKEVIYFERKSLFIFILKKLLTNKLFILNNKMLKKLIYKIYKKFFFFSNEKKCGRIFIKLQKI